MTLSDELKQYLSALGCHTVGFADLRSLPKESRQNFDCGVLIGLFFTREAMLENMNGLPRRYYDEHDPMTRRLKELANLTADFLAGKGYKAWPKITSTVVQDDDYRSILPHKTVATLAGVGWIGRCSTLVTREAGSALRLVVVLTNAPLECGVPITKSMCPPNCRVCADVCPGKAHRGGQWEAGVDRDNFYDAHACRAAARARAKELLGIEETMCGLCIANCPFTKRGLGYE